MILKNTDDKIISNKYEQSGIKAEKDMCFYLKRAYQTEDYIYVINDLRLKMEDDYAQIDHLIIHRFGFIIVESKSVTSKVCVNKQGEWKRIYNDIESGMPSPIQQAKRQADFLKKYLMQKDSSELYRDNLVNKYTPRSIEKFGYDVLVAVSDSGIIEREDIELDEICKADTITDRVSNIVNRYTKQFSKILSINIPSQFHQDSIKKLSNLLISEHCPSAKSKVAVKKEVKIVKEEAPKEEKKQVIVEKSRKFDKDEIYLCKHCKSPNLEMKNGQYGFYFKCLFCHKNTPLKLVCSNPTQNCKPILNQDGLKFYRTCNGCNEQKLFFTNDSTQKEETPVEPTVKAVKTGSCKKCKSTNVQIAYGKYGYYYKCQDCKGNSNISLSCKKSSCKPKLKKEKEKFYKVCKDCNTKELFFVNDLPK